MGERENFAQASLRALAAKLLIKKRCSSKVTLRRCSWESPCVQMARTGAQRATPPNPLQMLVPESISQVVLSKMRLTLDRTIRRTPHGAARDVCQVGSNPTCSRPALQGCQGLYSYDSGYARHE